MKIPAKTSSRALLNGRATTAPVDTAARISSRGRAALAMLQESYECALDLQRDKWDFAVEIETLRKAGLSDNDLRWLVCNGYIEHAREVSLASDKGRTFCPGHGLTFHRRTCFTLCKSGLPFLTAASEQLESSHTLNTSELRLTPDLTGSQLPKWDSDRQELWLGPDLIKRFKVPAANQVLILAVFEEEQWPSRIDDPLPQQNGQDPKRRLHDTINSLNRKQKNGLIRFSGDGRGAGVRWKLVARDEASNHSG